MIPGFLISILSFPGVIVHELAHLLFCRWRGLVVFDVCFLRFGSPAGYVVHEAPKDFTTSFLVCIGPFILNSLLCMFICLPAFVPVKVFGRSDPVSYFMLWLGISIGMHAFPSTKDASNLWESARRAVREGNLLAITGFPLVVVIYVANVLSFFWLDYIYGAAIGLGLPAFLFRKLT